MVPALGDVVGIALLGEVLDGLLRLLFAADEKHLFAAGGDVAQEVLGDFELLGGKLEVDDVNAVARLEDEGLHFGVPTLGAVSEMDAGVQQFLDVDSMHDVLFSFMTPARFPRGIAAASVSTE
jgi:hypothetical protein